MMIYTQKRNYSAETGLTRQVKFYLSVSNFNKHIVLHVFNLQPEGTLERNRIILKVSLQHITKFHKHFSDFSVAKDVTHRLQKIKWEAGEIISSIQRIQSVLLGVRQKF